MSGNPFIIELSAPLDPADIPAYCKNMENLLKLTKKVSIASHSTGLISGFDRSYNLARYLTKELPDIDIVFHVTCRDLNIVNIFSRLTLLKMIGVKSLLAITGEGYEMPNKLARLHYLDSTQLVEQIINDFNWFDTIAIAGYPGGKANTISGNEEECDRLFEKLSIGLNTIITQCIFDMKSYQNFLEKMTPRLDSVRIIPSLAIFKDQKSLDYCCRITRVKPNETLKLKLAECKTEDVELYSRQYLVELCRSLRKLQPNCPINICTFGQFKLTETIIEDLLELDHLPTMDRVH